MSEQDPVARARQAVGENAAAQIEAKPEPCFVGLGTGDTAAYFIRALAERNRRGDFSVGGLRCVATSTRSAELARSLGLTVMALDEVPYLDVTVDGADEIDPDLRLIKGAGGALLFEKLVAQSSRRMIVVGDPAKKVAVLGQKRLLPIEIVPFGARHTAQRLREVPGVLELTPRKVSGASYVTDGGHHILDAKIELESAAAAPELHARLKSLAGVVETGFFCHEAAFALIGEPGGTVEALRKKPGA